MIKLLTVALQSWICLVKLKERKLAYDIEDEIDRLAADGSPAAKLRIERLGRRLKAERERPLRSSNDHVN